MDQGTISAFLRDPLRVAAGRRAFLRAVGGTSAMLGMSTLLSGCGDNGPDGTQVLSPPPVAPLNEADTFNFALNLEYLEAQFYTYAVTGAGISSDLLGGTGTAGAATGGRMVTFTDGSLVKKYAAEIAFDEVGHVSYLRRQLGSYAVAQPAIDIGVSATSAFSVAAQAAGVVPAGGVFDPYASELNFLLAGYLFQDVGVTAYIGAATTITTAAYVEAAAGILAAEAYHAGLHRTLLYNLGLTTQPDAITDANAISDARDSLDNSKDDDQGITDAAGNANLVPTDSNSLAFSRTTGEVLSIVYLSKIGASKGGFFPAGLNGRIVDSTVYS